MEYVRDDFTVPLSDAVNSGTDTPWEELNWRAWKGDVSMHSKTRRHHYWTSVEDEVQQLTLRLNALEADRHQLKETVDSLRENGELKLLQEIAKQLRELHGMEWKGLQEQDSLSNAVS
jgi:predicted RNase H-like nuclease (RuvC/YqgF family)